MRFTRPAVVLFVVLLVLAAGSSGGAAAGAAPRSWLDVPYASASPAQRLDLYAPVTGKGPSPVVVWVHGGGWAAGDKRLSPASFQLRLVERGYAVASVNYRLSGEATFPAQIQDVKAAVRWLRANAGRYGLDPKRVGAWGSSAGGHLAALLGTSGGVEALEGASLGNRKQSSRVQAVVDWYGPTDFLVMDSQAEAIGCPRRFGHGAPGSPEARLLGATIGERPELARAANPVTYASRDDPPTLIEHGSADCTVAPGQSVLLRDALAPLLRKNRVWFNVLEGSGHGGPAFSSEENIALVLRFLDRYVKR